MASKELHVALKVSAYDDVPFKSVGLSRGDSLYFCTDGFYTENYHLLTKKVDFNSITESIKKAKDDSSLIEIDI